MKMQDHVLITGGTGFIGQALTAALLAGGHQVTILTRQSAAQCERYHAGAYYVQSLPSASDWSFTVVVNLAGENLFDKRWNNKVKQGLIDSRVQTTDRLVQCFSELADADKPRVFISGSAVGYYGTHTDQVATEQSDAGNDFAAKLCALWENAATQAREHGVRTNIIRIGVVLGPGGALKQMLPPFKLGLGGRLGSGKQWFSWVSLDDVVALIMHVMKDAHLNTVLNATAPQPVTNAEFTRTLGQALRRPTWLPMPSMMVKLMFGEAASLLLTGRPVLPERAGAAGFVFQYPELNRALSSSVT